MPLTKFSPQKGNALYRADVDGLRALAILSVLAFHIFPKWFGGGFVGVDIFFVISGFVITSVIYNELESGSFSIVQFYVRRIRRIIPGLIAILVPVCIVGWLLLLPTDFEMLANQIAGGSTFTANIVMWVQTGYFWPDATLKPLLHLWSLGVEEQYYIFFPVLCIIFYRAHARWRLFAALLIIAFLSMALNVSIVTRHTTAAFFLPFSRVWELFVGAGLAMYWHKRGDVARERSFRKLRDAGGFLGLALLLASIVEIPPETQFPGWWALAPTAGAALVINSGPFSWVNGFVFSRWPAVFIGLISYPLYLWHWPIYSFISIENSWTGQAFSFSQKVVMVVASFFFACVTYRFVEYPIRTVSQKDLQRRTAVWLLFGISITAGFGVLVIGENGIPTRFSPAVVAIDHDYATDAVRSYQVGRCFLLENEPPQDFSDSCVDPPHRNDSRLIAFVWGDSHAADLMPGFRKIEDPMKIRLAQFTSALCAPIIGYAQSDRPICVAINDEVMRRIKQTKPNVVVLSALWSSLDFNSDLVRKVQRTIESLKSVGVQRVLVVGSAPYWKADVPKLIISQLRASPTGTVPHRLEQTLLDQGSLGNHDDKLLQAAAYSESAIYVPMFNSLCDKTTCLVATGPRWQDVVTYDLAHFTRHGSALVAERIWPIVIHAN